MTDSIGHNRLAALRDAIATEASLVRSATEELLIRAMACGDAMIEAKGLLDHGEFEPWLRENVRNVSPRTARLDMSLAANRAAIETKLATVATLTLREAARLVAGRGQRSPRPRLLPATGCFRHGVDGESGVYIVPSTAVGFYFITAYRGEEATLTRRPVASSGLDDIGQHLGIDVAAMTFRDQACLPVDRNPFDGHLEGSGDVVGNA